MKKVLTVIVSAIAFGLIAGLVMVGINIFSVKSGLVSNNAIVNEVEKYSNNIGETTETTEQNTNNSQTPRTYNYNNYSYYDTLPELITDVMPTVVSITNMQKFKQNGYSMFGFRVQPREYEAPASGSGVIVGMTDSQIIILTNNHVVESSSSLSVTFNDTETVEAAIKGTDSSKDLAIISVDKKNIKTETLDKIKISKLGNSDNVRVGDSVVAIGNALGIGQSVTTGIVSAKDREIDELGNASKLIQTDAAINPGNSGGALINLKGELIGINVAKSSGNAIEGMGYAIPINVANDVIDTMSKRKDREEIPEAEQGQLGINARNIDSQTAESLDMPEGIYVYKIMDDSPVKNSELKEKDIIIAFDDQNVKTVSELQELLRYTRAGQEVSIKVKRLDGGSYVEKSFKVTLGKKTVDKTASSANDNSNANQGSQNNQGNEGYYSEDPFDEFFKEFGGFGGFRNFGW